MRRKINTVLIANRGEIAVRIVATLKKMGIRSVVIFAPNDHNALFVKKADLAIPLGGNTLSETYLNINQIIDIARSVEADAIHPGYGLLSENHQFAEACAANNLIFIGPDANTINSLGNKTNARNIAQKLQIPIIDKISEHDIKQHDLDITFPVLIKASYGGGGRGMRICQSPSELEEQMASTKAEAILSFHNDEIYIEKYIPKARHIEVQILGDNAGNVVHLFDRECSIQRRYQKIIEEAPATSISQPTKEKLYKYATSFAKHVSYVNAGTFEFLVDEDENIYFIEVNTRIQVEHPVTELITGIDIVEQQINIAEGSSLQFTQRDIQQKGHAIEARVCCEDPATNFLPSPGTIHFFHVENNTNIRIDSGVSVGDKITTEYDSLLFKTIGYGPDRNSAIANLSQGLDHTHLHGIKTNQQYLSSLITSDDFKNNRIHTSYVENNLKSLFKIDKNSIKKPAIIAAFLHKIVTQKEPKKPLDIWQYIGLWRSNLNINITIADEDVSIEQIENKTHSTEFNLDNMRYKSDIIKSKNGHVVFKIDNLIHEAFVSKTDNYEYFVSIKGQVYRIKRHGILNETKTQSVISDNPVADYGKITAPLHGKILNINVKPNEKIKKGNILLTIESMKIENKIIAQKDGMVKSIYIQVGQQVEENMELMLID